MCLQNISNRELVTRIEKLVRGERRITHLVLLHILEIEERKIFADLGFDSMYSYLTQKLGYSESSAYRRLQSARLLKKVPALSEKIESGSLNLSQLTQVQKCLKQQFQKTGVKASTRQAIEILKQIENKNSFATEQTLAKAFDLPIQTRESLKPQKDETVRIEITLSKEQFEDLEQAQSLLSHICHTGSLADVIGYLAKSFNKRKIQGRTSQDRLSSQTSDLSDETISYTASEQQVEPTAAMQSTEIVALEKHNTKKSPDLTQSFAATPEKRSTYRRRKYISVHTRRELLAKSNHRCEYQNPNTGQRCHSQYQLQIEHIQPWALGGTNDIHNLKTLCRTHNNLTARKSGLQK